MKMSTTARLVKVRYAARAQTAITKKLFGYKGWQTKTGKKTYQHKPMTGRLEGMPIRRLARATIALPQSYLAQAKIAIEEAGGVVKSVEPIILNQGREKTILTSMFSGFIEGVAETVRYASEAQTKDLYVSALDKAIRMTKKFESLIAELDEYDSARADGRLVSALSGLRSLADKDLDGAKIQSAFFASDLEKNKNQIFK
jgi:hypothetical protein